MTEGAIATDDELEELRRRLDRLDGTALPPPWAGFPLVQPPAPDSWEGRYAATQERKRQERGEAMRLEQQRILEEQKAIADAAAARRLANAPRIAELDDEIEQLDARIRLLEQERQGLYAEQRKLR